MFHDLNMVLLSWNKKRSCALPISKTLLQDYLRLQKTFLSQSCTQWLFLGIISISNSIFSNYHSEDMHESHDLSIIHFQIHIERQRVFSMVKQRKDVLMASLGMCSDNISYMVQQQELRSIFF